MFLCSSIFGKTKLFHLIEIDSTTHLMLLFQSVEWQLIAI